MRKYYPVVCILLAVLILTLIIMPGCTSSSLTNQVTATPSTRTITDMAGNQVVLPTKIDRIATQFPATNQIIFMLGGADKIVASTTGIQDRIWFAKIYPRLIDIPKLFNGAVVNIEELIGVKPDVVFIVQGNDALAGLPHSGEPSGRCSFNRRHPRWSSRRKSQSVCYLLSG
jgi:ABC-type Fe3+-hydroxamate transport system substrate-binding protein